MSDQPTIREIDEPTTDVPALQDVAIEELTEVAGAGTAFCVGSAGCPSSAGTASSFG